MDDLFLIIRGAFDAAQGVVNEMIASRILRISLVLPILFMAIRVLFLRKSE